MRPSGLRSGPFFEDLERRQGLAFEHFEEGATAGGDVAHLLLDAVFGDGRQGVAAACDAEGGRLRNRLGDLARAVFKGRELEHADAPATIKAATDVADDDLILDIGPQTAARLAAQLKSAGTIVWNGPVGVFEFPAFENGTREIAQAIAQSPAFSIAGGGDTLAAIAKYGIEQQVGYISTGGGAFLEVLEGKTLPAFEILEKRAAAQS